MNAVPTIGVLPAAGLGSRLRPLPCPKELLPIAFIPDGTGKLRPVMAAEFALMAMRDAHIRRCLVVTCDRKPEILRYLGDGSDLGISLAYVNQVNPLGLAAAVDAAHDWFENCNVCLALPDAVFSPTTALLTVTQMLSRVNADVVLGVFPSAQAEELGPVRLEGTRVLEVLEKPNSTDLANTWGVAAWTPRFSALLHRSPEGLRGLSIGQVFAEGVALGLDVRAVFFESGSYSDLGTGERLAAMVFPQGDYDGRKEARDAGVGLSSVGQNHSGYRHRQSIATQW